jgi:hypothetical protein
VGDDPQQLRKRFDEGQLTVFETTLAVSGSSATFAAAEAAAKARLSKKKDFPLRDRHPPCARQPDPPAAGARRGWPYRRRAAPAAG